MLTELGILGIHTPGPKLIDYVSLDPEKFSSRLVGDGVTFSAKGSTGLTFIKRFLADSTEARSSTHVLINGMFFNVMRAASPEHKAGATIGESAVPGVQLPQALPIHSECKEYFLQHRFEDGSMMTTGPELCRDDRVQFGPELLREPRFQWETKGFIPGMLRHANHPNARSAIVFPGRSTTVPEQGDSTPEKMARKFDRIRVLAVTTDNGRIGAGAKGLDMSETARLALRLSQMNTTRGGQGINLDGGQSTQLLVLHKTVGL